MHASTLMLELISVFEDHVPDKSSLVELKACLEDREFGTERSRNIFNTIRAKTLKAERRGRADLLVQRSFEESCAKALFNFGRPSAAYDHDSQFWIVPHGFRLAKQLQHPDALVVDLLTKT